MRKGTAIPVGSSRRAINPPAPAPTMLEVTPRCGREARIPTDNRREANGRVQHHGNIIRNRVQKPASKGVADDCQESRSERDRHSAAPAKNGGRLEVRKAERSRRQAGTIRPYSVQSGCRQAPLGTAGGRSRNPRQWHNFRALSARQAPRRLPTLPARIAKREAPSLRNSRRAAAAMTNMMAVMGFMATELWATPLRRGASIAHPAIVSSEITSVAAANAQQNMI